MRHNTTKIRSFAVQLSAGITAVALSLGVSNSHAASAPTPLESFTQAPQAQPVEWESERVEKLRRAYYLLDKANGDYEGHRVEAMHSIKKAAEILGVELHYTPHGEESQWKSDQRMREAKHILEDLADYSHGREKEHINTALKHINHALEVR